MQRDDIENVNESAKQAYPSLDADKLVVFKKPQTKEGNDYDSLLDEPGKFLIRYSSNDKDITLSVVHPNGKNQLNKRCGEKAQAKKDIQDFLSKRKVFFNNIGYCPLRTLIYPTTEADPNGWILTQEGKLLDPLYKLPNLKQYLPDIFYCFTAARWVDVSDNRIGAYLNTDDQFEHLKRGLKLLKAPISGRDDKSFNIRYPHSETVKKLREVTININWIHHYIDCLLTDSNQIQALIEAITYKKDVEESNKDKVVQEQYFENVQLYNEQHGRFQALINELNLALDNLQEPYYQRLQPYLRELKRNSCVVAQAVRTRNLLFAQVPNDVLHKIIACNSRDILERSDVKIAENFNYSRNFK